MGIKYTYSIIFSMIYFVDLQIYFRGVILNIYINHNSKEKDLKFVKHLLISEIQVLLHYVSGYYFVIFNICKHPCIENGMYYMQLLIIIPSAIIKCLLWDWFCTPCFKYPLSFNPHDSCVRFRLILLSSFYRWENWSLGRLSNLPITASNWKNLSSSLSDMFC